MVSRMAMSFYTGVVLVALVVNGSFSLAGLIVEPAGTTIFNGSDTSEWDTAKRVSGLSFNFYSMNVSEIWVSENGNLNFAADGDFFPTNLGAPSRARIAPLWDDFLLLQNPKLTVNNRVVVDHQSGRWLAVTWENIRLELETRATGIFPSTTRSAQVVIFESDQLIRGHQFLKNDIAFGYRPHVLGTSDFGSHLSATVGLDSGAGVFAPILGSATGRVLPSNADLLAWEENSFLLFRPTDATISNYQSSKQFLTAVPEPSSISLIAIALCLTTALQRRASKRKNPNHGPGFL